ncbi:MAG: DOMON-like domain-containing protein [Rhodocyclaceae bacterium]
MPPNALPTDYPLSLRCHPATPAPLVRTLEACVAFQPDGSLLLTYRLRGEIARLRIPGPQDAERTDGLWQHSCFEAFVGRQGDPAYREFNFSPSGQWAAYAFSDERLRDAANDPNDAPQITVHRFADRIELAAIICAAALPPGTAVLQIGLAAVVEATETVDGGHSYWALTHPADRPDFHRRAAFALELADPRQTV